MTKKLIIIPSIAFILITTVFEDNLVEGIKCYVCQSNVDPKCADPFDNLTLPITDCDAHPRADLVPNTELDLIVEKSFFAAFSQPAPVKPLRATMCRKIRQKVNGEWRTIRGCGYLGSPGDTNDGPELHCKMRHGTNDVFMETCACNNKAGCNGSLGISNLVGDSGITLLISLSALVYYLSLCNDRIRY